jgi:hypothetical protein
MKDAEMVHIIWIAVLIMPTLEFCHDSFRLMQRQEAQVYGSI